MAQPNDDILALWRMPAHEFNEWRRQNDLPQLLAFFKRELPHFEEWQRVHAITDETFLAATQPSKFFRGDKTMHLWSSTGPDWEQGGAETTSVHFSERWLSNRSWEERQREDFGEVRYHTNWSIWFVPYFRWLRKAKGMRQFRIPGQANDYDTDFSYRRTEAVNTIYSRTYLFGVHRVLKLGGVTIRGWDFDQRNLDFVDLDFLTVVGEGRSWETEIAYASCRRLAFKKYSKPFVVFEKSPLEAPVFHSCHLERFKFVESGLSRPRFADVRMSRCELTRCLMWEPSFERCDFVDLKFTPPRRMRAEYLADGYRRLRVAFQSQGNRREASRFYFEERFQMMRALAFPIFPRGAQGLPGLVWADTFNTMYDHWLTRRISRKKIVALLARNVTVMLKILVYPPYSLRFLWLKAKVLPELVDYLLWGFGERPIRIFWWMALVIAAFTASYYSGDTPTMNGNLAEAFACSVKNFATVDCEHAGALDAAGEAIIGIILLGMMVAGFSNRTRY
jgi:hypothetical protein